MTKYRFIEQLQLDATAFAVLYQNLENFRSTYFDCGYNTGETAISDADTDFFGLKAADIISMITFLESLNKYMHGDQTATIADFDATLNKMRNDI